jgi:hypothetical protein
MPRPARRRAARTPPAAASASSAPSGARTHSPGHSRRHNSARSKDAVAVRLALGTAVRLDHVGSSSVTVRFSRPFAPGTSAQLPSAGATNRAPCSSTVPCAHWRKDILSRKCIRLIWLTSHVDHSSSRSSLSGQVNHGGSVLLENIWFGAVLRMSISADFRNSDPRKSSRSSEHHSCRSHPNPSVATELARNRVRFRRLRRN